MRTILIAHRDVVFAEQLGAVLRNGAYRVIGCPVRGRQSNAASVVTLAIARSPKAPT
jgi:hypothetical protein